MASSGRAAPETPQGPAIVYQRMCSQRIQTCTDTATSDLRSDLNLLALKPVWTLKASSNTQLLQKADQLEEADLESAYEFQSTNREEADPRTFPKVNGI